MLPCQLADQIGRNLGGIRKRFPKHVAQLGQNCFCILLRNGQLRMLCPQMRSDGSRSLRFIVGGVLHPNGKGFNLPVRNRLHQGNDSGAVNSRRQKCPQRHVCHHLTADALR